MSDDTAVIEERVKSLVAKQLKVDADTVRNEASFEEDLGADSLDRVELIMAIEDEFELTIVDDDAENIETVQHVIDYIVENTAD